MDLEALEVLTQETAQPTLNFPIFEKEKEGVQITAGYSLLGSRVYLFNLTKEVRVYASAFIAPSNYGLNSKRIEDLDKSLRYSKQLALSPILKNKTLDEVNADFLSLLLPPYPLQTQDLLNNKPRIIYHLFSEEHTGLLRAVIHGLK